MESPGLGGPGAGEPLGGDDAQRLFQHADADADACGLMVGVMGVSGCSSSEPAPDSSPTQPPISGAIPSPTFTGATAEFCNAFVSLGQATVDLQAAQTSQDAAAVDAALEAFTTTAQDLASSVPADAPAAVKTALTKLATTIAGAAQKPPPIPGTRRFSKASSRRHSRT